MSKNQTAQIKACATQLSRIASDMEWYPMSMKLLEDLKSENKRMRDLLETAFFSDPPRGLDEDRARASFQAFLLKNRIKGI